MSDHDIFWFQISMNYIETMNLH